MLIELAAPVEYIGAAKLARLQHIQIRVGAPLKTLLITAVFPSGDSEAVFSESTFESAYATRSAAVIENSSTTRLAILRNQGWPEAAVELRVRALREESDPFILLF